LRSGLSGRGCLSKCEALSSSPTTTKKKNEFHALFGKKGFLKEVGAKYAAFFLLE
jgi:hypothetical protein